MPELSQLERALRIIQRLVSHDGVTVRELYDLFDRKESIRTIQRTLDSIMASNIPLRYTTGAHGERYYGIHRAFDFIPLTLSPDEILAAILLAQFGDLFRGTCIGEDIEGVFNKMDQLIPPGSIAITSALRGITDVFQLRQPGMVSMEARGATMKDMLSAIIERRVCWIEYRRAKEGKKSRFEFYPYSLLFHAGAIYVIGFQPYYENWLYLAVQRIVNVSATDDIFERDPDYKLDSYLKDNFGIWYEEPVDVVIHFDKIVANSIEERTWHHSQSIRHLDNGDIELKMHIGPSEELIAWILRWGTFAEVVEPESLRLRIKEIFNKGARIYQ